MNLILTNYEKMTYQAMTVLFGVFLTSITNFFLQVPTDGLTINEIAGYGGMAFLAFATWFFRKMKIEIDIRASNKENDDDEKGRQR